MTYQFTLTPGEILGCPHCLADTKIDLTITPFPGGIVWAIEPQVPNGATVSGYDTSATLQPGTIGTNYIVTATSLAVPSCVATTKVTVCTIASTQVVGDFYIDDDPVGESHKRIWHLFATAPFVPGNNAKIAEHFEFVQYVKGYAKLSDGSTPESEMYGMGPKPIDYPNYVIDSRDDDDPAYGNGSEGSDSTQRPCHGGGQNSLANQYSIFDNVNVTDWLVGAKCDLQFKVGIYCAKGVPMTGASVNVDVGIPFWENVWLFQYTVKTNAMGNKVITHP